MISELLHKAKTSGLSGCSSLRQRDIHWFIELDQNGNLLGFCPTVRVVETSRGERKERRGKTFAAPANYHMQWKNEKIQSVCTNDSNWLPDFLCGPANEIFPAGVSGKAIYRFRDVRQAIRGRGKKHPDRQRLYKLRLWRHLVFRAERENPANQTIRAIANYIRSPEKLRFEDLPLPAEGEERKRLLESFEKGNEYISFRVNGRIAVSDPELKAWWKRQVQNQREEVVRRLAKGRDAYLPDEGPITEYFPSVFGGVPFASFNCAPFVSYGLGNQTATFRLETAEQVAAALNALLDDPHSSMSLGDETAVFWAKPRDGTQQIAADFMQLLDQPDPLAVQDYLKGIWGTRPPEIETADFYVAILLKGTGRFSVRSWHTDTLGNADRHVRRYFQAITLADEEEQRPALRDLASATIAKSEKTKPPPATYNAVFEAAWRGTPLPFDLFVATIERQAAELAVGHEKTKKAEEDWNNRLRHRCALIQLYFNLNKGISMNQETVLSEKCKDPAILCGRLLALLDKIHREAHVQRDEKGKVVSKGTASSPANRFYRAASKTPALVFPRLLDLARDHLAKIDKDWAYRLEFGWQPEESEKLQEPLTRPFIGLAQIVEQLKIKNQAEFPRLFSLEEQGRFALGFYYERCRKWPTPKDSKEKSTENSNND